MYSFQANTRSHGTASSAGGEVNPLTPNVPTDTPRTSPSTPKTPTDMLNNPELLFQAHQQAYQMYLLHLTQAIHNQQEQAQLSVAPSKLAKDTQSCTFSPGAAPPATSREQKLANMRNKHNNKRKYSETAETSSPRKYYEAEKDMVMRELQSKLTSREVECQRLRAHLNAKDQELNSLKSRLEAQQSQLDRMSVSSMSSPTEMSYDYETPSEGHSCYQEQYTYSDDSFEKHELSEKLKKLGGPPSDVYHRYVPGYLPHPAFLQKEDWMNMYLRPTGEPSMMDMEKQSAYEAEERRTREMAETEDVRAPNGVYPSSTIPFTRGYWSGNWVPTTAPIDFTKIELRKTSCLDHELMQTFEDEVCYDAPNTNGSYTETYEDDSMDLEPSFQPAPTFQLQSSPAWLKTHLMMLQQNAHPGTPVHM